MSEINDFLDGKQSSEIDSFLGPDAPKPAGAIRKVADLGLSVGKGVIAVPEAAVGLANLVTGGHAGKLAESAGVRFKDAKDVLSGWQSDDFKGKQQQFQQADGILEKTGVALSNPSLIANTVAESLPLMGAGGVGARALLGAAPKIGAATAGAIGEGIAGAGSSGEQYRQESTNGLLTGKQAALASASGAATAAFGAAGGKLAQKLGIGDIDTMLAGGTTRVAAGAAPKGAIRRMAEGAASEGLLEELPQSLSEQGFQNVALDRPVTQGMEDAGVMGVLTGGAMGAGAGAISRAAQPPTPPPATPPTDGTTPPPAAPAGPVPALGYSPLAGTPTVFPDGSVALNGEQEFARRYAPQKPSEAMGLDPAAGPLSAAAVTAVDTGAHQEIQLQQANEADQAAYEQATAEQEQRAAELDTATKPITHGPIAEAAMSDDDKRAIMFSNKTVADGGIQYKGTLDGDILNGQLRPYKRWEEAIRRVKMEGKDWRVAKVQDGFVARRKDANGPSTDVQPGDTGSTGGRSTDSPASVGLGATDGNGVGAQSGRSPDAVLDQAGELPKRVDAAPVATTRAQPTTLGKQTTATAGLGFTAKDVTRVPNPAPRADTTPAAQAVEAPAVVESNAAASEGVPAAGSVAVEGDGIDQAAHAAATSPLNDLPQPTDGQKDAGNYKKGHVNLNGLDLSIENPAGSVRSGKDKSGKAWSNTLQHHYGYIKGTVGNDKDHVDLFVKPSTPTDYNGPVFVIDQVHPDTGRFDEHKVVVGAKNGMEARRIYQANYAKGWKGLKAMTPMPFDQFKTWVKDGPKNKPLSSEDQASQPTEKPNGTQAPETQQAEAQQSQERAPGQPVEEQNLQAAKNLLAQQKAATGNAVAEGAIRKKLRDLAAKTPISDAKTVSALDIAATRLGMGEGKLKGLEFAPAAAPVSNTQTADAPELSESTKARNLLMELQAKQDANGMVGDDRLETQINQIKREIAKLDDAQAEKPGTVNVPPTVAEAFTAQMQKQKGRITRLKNEADKAGSLEDKKAAQLKVTAAEATLRQMRLKIFDAEDAAVKSVEQGITSPFNDFADLFQSAAEEIAKLTGQNDELDAEMQSYEAKPNPTYSGETAVRQKLQTIAERLGFSVNKSKTGWHASGTMLSIPTEDADLSSAVSADHVFAHELGHGVMTKRGVSIKGFPDVELRKRVANWDELVAASKEFRPGVHNHTSDSARKHAKKANEIAADAIASVLIGDKPLTMLQPFMDWLGITKVDLGLQTVEEANAESRAASGAKTDDLDAMFDDVLAEEVAKDEAKNAPQPKPKNLKQAIEKRKAEKAPRTATKSAASAAKNVGSALTNAIDGLGALFGQTPNDDGTVNLNSGVPVKFNAETYAKAKPLFQAAIADMGEAGKDLKEAMRAVIRMVLDKFGAQAAGNMKPYVLRFIEERALENSENQADTVGKDEQNGTKPDGNSDATSPGIQDEQPGELQPDAGGVRRGNAKSASSNASRGPIKDAPPDFVPSAGGLTREGSWYETAKRNIDLIELAIKIDAEKRPATPDEQAKLSKYVGFGASAIRNDLFPIPPSYAKAQEPNRLIWPQYVRNDRFKPLAERIEALPREWQQSILQSSQYAHYTSEGIIRSVWGALERMGFKGGQVFEPGMGIGSFAMLMPDAVRAESRYTGVEFDGPTALIAKLLSPQQNMIHGDFIKGKYPKNFFDVNVGNPPFSQTKIFGDPEYAKKGFMLHDFFFAKGIDLVRPGGIQVFVTSKGTMDKQTDKARKYLSERADLLGAIRLPSTAFEDNAGTSVVTDVIFLRKRLPGEAPGGEAWANTATVETPDGPVVVNEYFAKHPEMVLGQQRISGNVDDQGRRINSNGMGGEKYTVVSYDATPAELEAKFAKAIEKLPAGAYTEKKVSGGTTKDARVDFDPSVKREGVVYIAKDGTLMRVAEGVGVPITNSVKLSAKEEAWMKSYVGLRDLVQEARLAQLSETGWEASLAKLNKAYDKFVKEHGHILDYRVMTRKSTDEEGNVVETESRIPKNRKLLREDYDQALVTSLESIVEDGSIVKSPFLKGRTIGKPAERKVTSIGDALAVSLDETGHFDLVDVGRRLNLDEGATIEALGNQIYQTPDGEWQLADEYLSGDVVAKLEEAEAAARINPDLQRNVEALKEAQPEKLGPAQISAKLGASWIPESHVNAFAVEIDAGQVTFDPRTETWQVDGGNKQTGRKAGSEYGTAKRSPSELLEAILNSRSIKITQTVDKKTVQDQEATTAANEMAKKIKDKFKGWVWTDTDRATELVESYNKNFNNIAPRKFDGSHLTLPGVSLRYKLHPHQLRAIWRMVQTGNTYLAHAVGAGKTIEMIAGGMEQKRLGLIKKPMYVVPNHMLEQFSNEFMELYPLANIMVADDENFSPERRKAFIASATLNNPDAIVITHDAFQRIGVKEESVAPIRDEILADLEIELSETAKSNDTRVRRGQLEQQIEAVKQRFDRIISAGSKDSTIKFEDMGVDFVFADEAHVFRKLDFHTAQQIKGIDPNGSKRALDMYVKTRILEQKKPGRSMVFASGTPVTNTMGELYTIMRFFAGAELDKSGISTFDAWARQFGEVAPALEPNAAGRYELIERFAKFDNVPELMSRVRQFMDVLTSDNLGALVKRPNIIGGKPNLNIIPTNSDLTDYMKGELASRIETSRAWKPSKDQPHNPDPIVAIITDGRFAAIDPRFFGGTLKEGDKSIITEMGDKVVASYHATKDDVYLDKEGNEEKIKGSTQIVFYNLGFGEQSQKNRGFNSRAAFTKRLTDGGIPRSEIAWFDDANSDAKKEAVFKAMRNGTIKVLIGSAKKMGTGVNVQKRLAVLHYQDPPWFPADVEQPHGRILRQGNQNEEIAIEWYTTKGTYQSTMWQMVGRKQRFIDQAFTGDKTLRSMDDLGEASLFEQAAAVASGDPRAIQLAGLKQDVERFTRLQAAHASEQISVRSALNSAEWQVESGQKSISTLEKAFKAIGEKYFAFIGGRVGSSDYVKPGEFGQAIKDEFNRVAADSALSNDLVDRKQIASLGAAIKITMDANLDKNNKPDGTFDLHVEFGGSAFHIATGVAMGADVDATGLARRIFNKINEVDTDLRKARSKLVANETDVIKLRKKLGAPFEYQQEMAEKYGELKRLEAELEAEGKATPAPKPSLVIQADGTANGEAPEASTNVSQTGAPEANTTDVAFSRPKFSRGAQSQANESVGRLANGIASHWENPPKVVIAFDMDDPLIPESVRKEDQRQRSGGATGTPEGFYYKGTVYLMSSKLGTPNDIARVLFHETLGHFGLRGTFGDSLKPILQQIATFRKAEVDAKLKQYGLKGINKIDRLIAAEEVLAELAQTRPDIGFVKRAIAAIRTWLRQNVPGFNNLRLSDNELIQNYILPARAWVERGGPGGGGGGLPAMSRADQTDTPAFRKWFGDSKVVDADGKPLVVYHGTPYDFVSGKSPAAFNTKDFGALLGKGAYFTSDPVDAEQYAGKAAYGGKPNILPVYVSLQNPKVVDSVLAKLPSQSEIVAQGFDGVVLQNNDGSVKWAIAFKPEQIKSATGNNGDFDAENPDIRFSRSLGDTLASATNSVRDVALPAGYKVNDLIGSVPGKLNWWHRSVGTMYNLAQRSAPFKRVFDSVQTFINDVSYYATEAADLAPNILPKLETWKDIAKSPLSAADTKAISAPIFEGTLIWARDESGKPVKVETLEAAAAQLTPEQKAQRLLRGDHISQQVLKMWQGLPVDQFETIINGKYERDMLKAGVVWTDAELKSIFNLTDKQIPLYREFRKATDKSLTNLAIADMLRFGGEDVMPIREQVLASKDVSEASETLRDYLLSLTDIDPDRADVLTDTADKMIEKGDRAKDLIDRGYAPLSRFGQYTLDVVHDGERVYFSMFESKWEAARMNRQMQAEYPGAKITQGTVSEQAYKMFAGVSPETLELFGDMLGLEAQGDDASAKAFQEYLKLAKSSRSAMKRLIHRKGIAGFNEDAGRVLAGFVYSNARQTASSLHMGEMTNAANDISQTQGELKDAAVKLVDYIKNPQEEAQKLRGLLFAQYIGGSVASAMVNMTQPLTMTFPWLSQYGGVASAAKQMTAAMKDSGKKLTGDAKLDAALHRAEEDGTVSPQEVHQLLQQSMGKGALQSGDGTTAGNAMATANNTLSRFSLGWGKLFSVAEQFNRRVTFIAAYRTAVTQGMADPDAFARKAVAETQGIYNRGNKPQWARGALGSTLFTFKQYSIAYVEMLSRMAKAGKPGSKERAQGQKAALLALGVLFLMSGAGGMPGADDLDDLISGALQALGYNFDSKARRKEFFVSLFGEGGAQFVERGVSGLPGVPIDVSGRMGLGNLVPGTGLFTKKTDHTRDVAELAGPAGDLAKRTFEAAGKLIKGDAVGSAVSVSPKAFQNLHQAYDMANMGMYRDASGKKVVDTDGYDAIAKAIGFQPTDVKRIQDASIEVQRMIGLNKMRESEIADKWALGMFEKNPAKVEDARNDLKTWNADNPSSPIRINFGQIIKRVQKMNETKTQRIAKTAPREIRETVRRELATQ